MAISTQSRLSKAPQRQPYSLLLSEFSLGAGCQNLPSRFVQDAKSFPALSQLCPSSHRQRTGWESTCADSPMHLMGADCECRTLTRNTGCPRCRATSTLNEPSSFEDIPAVMAHTLLGELGSHGMQASEVVSPNEAAQELNSGLCMLGKYSKHPGEIRTYTQCCSEGFVCTV